MGEQLVLPHQMREVRPAVTFARLAGAFGIQGSKVAPVGSVLEVYTTAGGECRPVTRQPGRQDAVEHVHAQGHDLQDPDRVPDPHEVPGFFTWQLRRHGCECLEHLLSRLSDRETTDRIAGKVELERTP